MAQTELPTVNFWNALSNRVRSGQDITDIQTMALISSVVGQGYSVAFAASVVSVWAVV